MGLRLRGPRLVPRGTRHLEHLPAAARFRDAVEELGGLFASFGHFLRFRADLLRPDYLATLRHIKFPVPPVPRDDALRILTQSLGPGGRILGSSLEETPLWSTPSRCAWRSSWEGNPVVVQLARPAVTAAEWDRFESGVKRLREPGIAHALTPRVLRQYHAWLRLPDSAARERAYLQTLASFPHHGTMEYPQLLTDLCAGDVTCWDWVDGKPIEDVLDDPVSDAVRKLAEGMLEQMCLVAVVDADCDFSSMVLTPDKRIALRRANRLVPIPPAMARTVLKYVTAVLAGNSQHANRQLVRMALGYSSAAVEAQLHDALSNLEPELKINLRFPPSVGSFESNWRALATVTPERPLYLDCLHRNLLNLGYLDAESAPRGMTPDTVGDAQWPVMGRLLKARMSQFSSRDTLAQWSLGSGLLMLELTRQATRLAEDFRDRDLAYTFAPAHEEDTSDASIRSVRLGIVIVVLLLVFLVCLRFGPALPGPWSGVATFAAVLSAGGLLWVLSRIG